MSWKWEIGRRPIRVEVCERGNPGSLYLCYWEQGKRHRKSLRRSLRDSRGRINQDTAAWAREQATACYEALLRPGHPPVTARDTLTFEATITLITDSKTGKYAVESKHKREVVNSLRYAARAWPGRTWASIRKNEFRALGRRKIEELLKADRPGYRSADKLLEHLVAIAGWLRDSDYIDETAFLPPTHWAQDLHADWRALSEAQQDYQSNTPRYTVAELQLLLDHAGEIDPRLELLLALGAELRLGQVLRAWRDQLHLDVPPAGTFQVFGAGKKRGTTVELIPEQRQVVDAALAGFLKPFEATGQNYPLFPGRFEGQHVTVDTIQKWFRKLEALVKIPHLDGRGAYGLRRVAVDEALRLKVSLKGLQQSGGWSDARVPTTLYAAHDSQAAMHEAAEARKIWRGKPSV